MSPNESSEKPRLQAGRGKRRALRRRLWLRVIITLRLYIVRGMLVLVPLGVTAYVLALLYRLTAGHLAPFVDKYAAPMPVYAQVIVSLVLFVSLLYLIGLTTAMVLGRRLIKLGEDILRRIPLVKTVYAASKQVVDVLSIQDQGANYQAAVIVDFPFRGAKTIAFTTSKIQIEGEGEVYAAFVPTTPNPTSGYLEILPPNLVEHSEMGVEEAFKAVMSAGIVSPNTIQYTHAPGPAVSGEGAASMPGEALYRGVLDRKRSLVRRILSSAWYNLKQLVRTRLLSGLVVLVPIGVTIFIINFTYGLTAGRITPLTKWLAGELPAYATAATSVVLLLILLYLTGYITTAVVGARVVKLAERVIERIPFVTTIYGATKQIVETVTQQDSGPKLQAPVLVDFPYPGARVVGFVVGKIQTSDGKKYVKVFVPTAPNITVGFFQMYEPQYVSACNMTVEEAIKMVVSCGIISPKTLTLSPMLLEGIE